MLDIGVRHNKVQQQLILSILAQELITALLKLICQCMLEQLDIFKFNCAKIYNRNQTYIYKKHFQILKLYYIYLLLNQSITTLFSLRFLLILQFRGRNVEFYEIHNS
jgi:hypothetical protein